MNMQVSSMATITATDVCCVGRKLLSRVHTHIHTHTLVDLCTPNSIHLDRQAVFLFFSESRESILSNSNKP